MESSSSSSSSSSSDNKQPQMGHVTTTTTYTTLQPATATGYSVHSGGQMSYNQQYLVQQSATGQTTTTAPQYVQYVTDPRQVQHTATTTTYKTTETAGAPYVIQEGTMEYVGHQKQESVGAYVTTTQMGEKIYGEQRLISTTSHVDESRASVISERVVEHEIRVPKKIVREEVVEKVIRIPEKQIVEEIIEESQIVREKIIEIAKPTIIEKVIEVPEIQLVERIVEVPEKIIQEKIIEQEKIVEQEVIIQIPKIMERERVVEIPEIEYHDKPYEKAVYVDDIQEVIVEKKVPVPQYVNVPVPEHVHVEKLVSVERKIPVPIEAEVTYEYKLPTMHPRYSKTSYPVYLPRFIEVPVATELLNQDLTAKSQKFLSQVSQLTKNAASLCEIEGLAAQIMKTDFQSQLQNADLQAAVLSAWKSEALPLHHETGQIMTKTVTTEMTSAPLQTSEIMQSSLASHPTYATTTVSRPTLAGSAIVSKPLMVETTTVETTVTKKHKKHHKKHDKH